MKPDETDAANVEIRGSAGKKALFGLFAACFVLKCLVKISAILIMAGGMFSVLLLELTGAVLLDPEIGLQTLANALIGLLVALAALEFLETCFGEASW